MQAFTPIQRACRVWEANPERLRVSVVKSSKQQTGQPGRKSNSSPSETNAEDSDSSTTDTDSSDSSTTDTEDSDSSGADEGYAYPSSTDTGEATHPSAPPMEEDDA
jgi:hypothetical protein